MKRREKIIGERLPPHSSEAERGVLGCCLLDPGETLARAIEELGTTGTGAVSETAGAFYELRHQILFNALAEMQSRTLPIDLITVLEFVKGRTELEQSYLIGLTDEAVMPSFYETYAVIVRGKWRLRKVLRQLTESVKKIYEEEPDFDQVEVFLDGIEAAVLGETQEQAAVEILTMREVAVGAMELLDTYKRGAGMMTGLSTGFGYFDKVTGGLHKRELIVIGARPSVGKTSLAMNIARHVAGKGVPVGVFTMEMAALDVGMRVICADARADFHQIRTGFMKVADHDSIVKCLPQIGALPLYFNEQPGLDIVALRASARRMKHRFGIQLFVVDYLQLMCAMHTRRANGSRAEEVGAISSGLKAMAKELNCPVLVLSQLSRDSEKQAHRVPQLSDLRESGSIEQDADMVGLMWKEKVNDDDEPEELPEIQVNLQVAKQRNGPTLRVEFMFLKAQMRFRDRYDNTGSTAPVTLKMDLPL